MLTTNAIQGFTKKQASPFFFSEEEPRENFETCEKNVFFLTCVGCSISQDLKLMGVGDFLGNVNLYETGSSLRIPSMQTNIGDGVRYLEFHVEVTSCLLAGTIGGQVFALNIEDGSVDVQFLAQFWGPVTSIRSVADKGKAFIIVGTGGGSLSLYQHNLGLRKLKVQDLTLKWSFVAHEPSTDAFNLHFGSLGKFSEVWSTISNSNQLDCILTASEDQTVRLWQLSDEISNPKLKQVLSGHTAAVTSVDWKQLKQVGEVLATCSDDKTVRIYQREAKEFKLQFVLDTYFLTDWHTLTYMALEDQGTRIAAVTENSYLVIWDLVDSLKHKRQTVLFAKKIHIGSIESLQWKQNTLVCAASDCAFTFISLADNEYSKL